MAETLTDREFSLLRGMTFGQWQSFYHVWNIRAARLHSLGFLDRRRWERHLGGYQYSINVAGHLAITTPLPESPDA